MSTVTLAEVKTALNETTTDNDTELQRLIDAAEAEYTEWVGPLTGSVTEVHSGGGSSLILSHPNAGTITAAAYTDGTTITTSDLDLDTSTGIVYWDYNTAGIFTSGTRNVTVTYTVGTLPANHREAIIADVAGLFAATQRGGGTARGAFPDQGYEVPVATNPITLFPRIRALAGPSIA
jgi:hypothetical protein